MNPDETRGLLIVTALRAGDVPVARVVSMHDVRGEPDLVVATSDIAWLLSYIETWWTDHWAAHGD